MAFEIRACSPLPDIADQIVEPELVGFETSRRGRARVAIGGGGWGPIVTTSLVGADHDPRTTIGSVNFAEFFLTVAVSAAYFSILDDSVWMVVGGLVMGGMFAAPFATYITRHVKTRFLLILVGVLISCISAYNLHSALAK
jgi:uncharacterized protein